MKHTEIALHRPVTTVVVFVALAMVGLIASRLLSLLPFHVKNYAKKLTPHPLRAPSTPRQTTTSDTHLVLLAKPSRDSTAFPLQCDIARLQGLT